MSVQFEAHDDLVAEAVRVGNHNSQQEAIAAALEQYVRAKKRLGILDVFGKVDYRPDYDYKDARVAGSKRLPSG